MQPVAFCYGKLFRARFLNLIQSARPQIVRSRFSRIIDLIWYAIVAAATVWIAIMIVRYVAREIGWTDVGTVLRLGAFTLLRVIVLIVLASLVWVPVGVAIGLRPALAERVQPLAQFLPPFRQISYSRFLSSPSYGSDSTQTSG